jgi:transcriptional regulator with XRE-family HTH domain
LEHFLTVGDRIRHLRKTVLRKTQREFAEEAHVDRSFLAKVESGMQSPSREFLAKVARGHHASIDWILNGTGAPQRGGGEDVVTEQSPQYGLGGNLPQKARGQETRATVRPTVVRSIPRVEDSVARWFGPRRPKPLNAADRKRLEGMVLRDPAGEKKKSKGDAPLKPGGMFGYGIIEGAEKLRLALAFDEEIKDTWLYGIAKDDALWERLGPVRGWEIEALREHVYVHPDAEADHLFGILNFVRWAVELPGVWAGEIPPPPARDIEAGAA